MRFYDKKEYNEKKALLTGEYDESFERVRDFFYFCSPNKYAQEECIFKTIDDFIAAQENNEPVANVYNNNMRKYCADTLKHFSSLPQNKLNTIITNIAVCTLLLLIFIIFKSYFIYNNLTSFELGSFEIFIIVYAIIFERFWRFLHKLIVNRKSLVYTMRFLYSVSIYLTINFCGKYLLEYSKFNIGIHPFIFIILGIFSIVFLIFKKYFIRKLIHDVKNDETRN